MCLLSLLPSLQDISPFEYFHSCKGIVPSMQSGRTYHSFCEACHAAPVPLCWHIDCAILFAAAQVLFGQPKSTIVDAFQQDAELQRQRQPRLPIPGQRNILVSSGSLGLSRLHLCMHLMVFLRLPSQLLAIHRHAWSLLGATAQSPCDCVAEVVV